MMLLRLLNPQGIAGFAAAAILALLLVVAKVDLRHSKKRSAEFEQLYRSEAKAHAQSLANFKLAAERARAADRANVERVRAAQASITERIENDYEARLVAARARAERLRIDAQAAAGRSGGGSASVPRLSQAAGIVDAPAGKDRLSDPDRLIATEQAIQLDALIRWVRAQSAVDPNARSSE